MPSFDEIVDSQGFLNDKKIIGALQYDRLIEK